MVTVCPLSLPFFWGSCQGIKVLLTFPDGETAKPKSLFSVWGFQKLGLWISQGKDQKDSGVRKLVPKPVNCKPVCVCTCVYPWGSQTFQGSCKDMCGFNQSASRFWTPCRLLSSWSVCRHSYHLEGFMFTFHTPLFPISLLIHPYSCCDGKTPEGQTKAPCEILILRKQSALMTDKNFLSTQFLIL